MTVWPGPPRPQDCDGFCWRGAPSELRGQEQREVGLVLSSLPALDPKFKPQGAHSCPAAGR